MGFPKFLEDIVERFDDDLHRGSPIPSPSASSSRSKRQDATNATAAFSPERILDHVSLLVREFRALQRENESLKVQLESTKLELANAKVETQRRNSNRELQPPKVALPARPPSKAKSPAKTRPKKGLSTHQVSEKINEALKFALRHLEPRHKGGWVPITSLKSEFDAHLKMRFKHPPLVELCDLLENNSRVCEIKSKSGNTFARLRSTQGDRGER